MLRPLLFLLGLVWITSAAPANLGASSFLEIGGCEFVNAYYVNCWWRRPNGDENTNYRLGYVSAADSFDERRERYCQPTQQRTEGDVIIESCAILGSMYERFTLFVASVQDCDAINRSCLSLTRSEEIEFTCMSSNVRLTLPPSSLEIEPEMQRLAWRAPDKEHSMLSFVLHRRRVLYRVEYREILEEDKSSDWMEWYTGYKTSIFLPTLIPGATYEVKVYASLDPPSSRFSMTSSPPMSNREWTDSSNILVFLVPKAMRKTSKVETFKRIEKEDISESTPEVAISDIVRPIHISRKIIIASAVTSFVVVVILAVAGYFLPWKRWCCCLHAMKHAGPKVLVDMDDSFSDEINATKPVHGDEGSPVSAEIFQPISEFSNFSSEASKATRVYRSCQPHYLRLSRSEGFVSDYGRQRNKQLDDTFSLNDLLDRDTFHNDATISEGKDDNGKVEMNQSREDLKTLLINCGAFPETKPVRYAKFRQSSVEDVTSLNELPSYLMTSECSDVDTDTSLDRSSGYVAEENGIDSIIAKEIGRYGDMMSYDDYDEEKQKQWQKFILSADQSHFSDSKSDDIPDYVMHVPTTPKDFCQNMSTFVSKATEDVNEIRALHLYDVTGDSFLRHSYASGDDNMAPACKNFMKFDSCMKKELKNSAESFLTIPVSNNNRSSVSGHSIDSGYSPDSPHCAISGIKASMDKSDVLGSHFDIRSCAQSDESDNDEYMTYVTT